MSINTRLSLPLSLWKQFNAAQHNLSEMHVSSCIILCYCLSLIHRVFKYHLSLWQMLLALYLFRYPSLVICVLCVFSYVSLHMWVFVGVAAFLMSVRNSGFHVRCYETLKEVKSQTSLPHTHICCQSLLWTVMKHWRVLNSYNSVARWNVFFTCSDVTNMLRHAIAKTPPTSECYYNTQLCLWLGV